MELASLQLRVIRNQLRTKKCRSEAIQGPKARCLSICELACKLAIRRNHRTQVGRSREFAHDGTSQVRIDATQYNE